jgi:hypothetical protein
MLGLSCMGCMGEAAILGAAAGGTCPETAGPPGRCVSSNPCHRSRPAPAPRRLLPGAEGARRALRRRVLHRRHQHRHLLPAGLQGADAAARELPLLRPCRAGRGRGLPALPALPARAGAAGAALVDSGCQRVLAQQAARLLDEPEAWDAEPSVESLAGPAGHQRPAPAPHLRAAAGRVAAAVPADAPPAHGQATAGRHRPADHARWRWSAASPACAASTRPSASTTA